VYLDAYKQQQRQQQQQCFAVVLYQSSCGYTWNFSTAIGYADSYNVWSLAVRSVKIQSLVMRFEEIP
jgi:hypothetical protein